MFNCLRKNSSILFHGPDLKILTKKMVRSYGTNNDEYMTIEPKDYQDYFDKLGYNFRVVPYGNGVKVTGRKSEIVLYKLKSI